MMKRSWHKLIIIWKKQTIEKVNGLTPENVHLSYFAKVFPLFPKLVLLAKLRWIKDGMKTFFKGLKK